MTHIGFYIIANYNRLGCIIESNHAEIMAVTVSTDQDMVALSAELVEIMLPGVDAMLPEFKANLVLDFDWYRYLFAHEDIPESC